MIQWFSKNEKSAIATICSTNITINKPGMEMISTAYACMLGLDSDDEKIAIQPISKDEYDGRQFPLECMFVLSGGKTYTRISSTDFVSRVGDFLHYDFKKKPKKFNCFFDQHENLLIIDLKKEIEAND